MFDELLIFNKKGMEKEEFQEEMIRIDCFDSNLTLLGANTLIGAYSIDATMVYTMNKDHEVYRRFVQGPFQHNIKIVFFATIVAINNKQINILSGKIINILLIIFFVVITIFPD